METNKNTFPLRLYPFKLCYEPRIRGHVSFHPGCGPLFFAHASEQMQVISDRGVI